jgi:hypothetical protein
VDVFPSFDPMLSNFFSTRGVSLSSFSLSSGEQAIVLGEFLDEDLNFGLRCDWHGDMRSSVKQLRNIRGPNI